MSQSLPDALEPLRQWILANVGGHPAKVVIHLHDGRKVQLPFPPQQMASPAPPAPPAAEAPEPVWVPSAFQKAILAALAGKALKMTLLGAAVADARRLKDSRALPELVERGLVELHPRLGYYRPDAPPPELAGEDSGE